MALTENILRNRGLELGGRIGEEADEKDWLRGEWLIVGTLASDAVTGGVGDRSYFRERFLTDPDLPPKVANRPHVLTVRPVEGKDLELEAFLDSLPKDQVGAFHRTEARRELDEELANINMIIWILNLITIVVLTLALGLLNVIFFMQRANEIGLLAALGYTKGFLATRTFLEAVVTVAAGWAVGILLSQGIYAVLNATLFDPKGLAPLTILTPRVLLFTTPVTVAVFSVAVVLWQLWRMDPVAIIERRDYSAGSSPAHAPSKATVRRPAPWVVQYRSPTPRTPLPCPERSVIIAATNIAEKRLTPPMARKADWNP